VTKGKFLLKFFFLLVSVGLLLEMLTPVFIPKWNPSTDAMKGFLVEEPNTIDVLALGTSRTIFSSAPWIHWQLYGIPVYSLAIEQQPTIASYYLLKEALKNQELKAVIYDVQALDRQRNYEDRESYFRQNFDNMPLSLNKMETVYHLIPNFEIQSFISYAFPFLRYHTRWNELSEKDYSDARLRRSPVKGGLISLRQVGIDRFPKDYPVSSGNAYVLPSENEKYLYEIIKLCQNKGIELILYATPIHIWTKEQSIFYQELSEREEHVHFIEFNTYDAQKEIGFDISKDFNDQDGHVNSFGAEKVMKKIGDYLSNELKLPDRRGDPRYASWDNSVAYVDLVKNDYLLNISSDFLSYLSYLKDPNYVVAISADDDATNGLSQEAYRLMKNIGLVGPKAFRDSYVALIDGGQVIYERADSARIDFSTTINGDSWAVVSIGGTEGALSKIVINELEYTPNLRGLNIVVYNKLKDEVVDISNFDTNQASMKRMYHSNKALK